MFTFQGTFLSVMENTTFPKLKMAAKKVTKRRCSASIITSARFKSKAIAVQERRRLLQKMKQERQDRREQKKNLIMAKKRKTQASSDTEGSSTSPMKQMRKKHNVAIQTSDSSDESPQKTHL